MEYIGQEHLKESVNDIYKKGAAIVIGPDKYGKTYYAQEVAKELNLEYILVESNVENTKALIAEIKEGNLYHIKDLHKARQQVLSRLLKLLEENIPQGAVILITTEATNTIDTILSRCLVLKCKKYRLEELEEVKELDKMLYNIYDTPTKLNEVNENIDKVIDSIEEYISEPATYKTNDLGDFDFKLVSNVLISKLALKGNYIAIRKVASLAKGFARNDYIPNWQAVHMILEEIRDDLI